MTRTWAVLGLILLVSVGNAWAQAPAEAQSTETVARTDDPPMDLALVAIDKAAQARKYILLFCYRANDEATRAARQTFSAALGKLADRALTAHVNVADPLEQDFVTKYDLSRSPLPLVLALAPNGAVTRSFVEPLAEAQFETAFVSPGTQKCLKALQDRKLVFVCVQNGKTKHNEKAMQGVKAFAAEEQYAKTTEIVTLDPTDPAEAEFLKQLKVDPQTKEAVTVFMAPPGTTVATYQGATKKDVLVAAAKTAAKGCDPKSGCCPPKKPAPPAKKKG